ncbi:g13256 [Coccomyxa viridis]|uniref:G13256 protein n=1 Tax=Coccomyxa viridis TaxID=1274662 RepID=A0ABP1GEY5_9CHLO
MQTAAPPPLSTGRVPAFSQPNQNVINEYLEDNETLIKSALQLLNQGRAAEAAKLQTLLQRNLMWLASIADSQAQPPQPAPAEASSQPAIVPAPHPLQGQPVSGAQVVQAAAAAGAQASLAQGMPGQPPGAQPY